MASVSGARRSLERSERILAVLLGTGFVPGFLLTPLGVETRMDELRTLAFAAFFVTVGLVLPLAGLVLVLLRRPRPVAVLAVVDAALLFLTAPADQALVFFSVPPPLVVTIGEHLLVLLGIGYIVYGTRVYDRHRG